jgi:hypothetical protein
VKLADASKVQVLQLGTMTITSDKHTITLSDLLFVPSLAISLLYYRKFSQAGILPCLNQNGKFTRFPGSTTTNKSTHIAELKVSTCSDHSFATELVI